MPGLAARVVGTSAFLLTCMRTGNRQGVIQDGTDNAVSTFWTATACPEAKVVGTSACLLTCMCTQGRHASAAAGCLVGHIAHLTARHRYPAADLCTTRSKHFRVALACRSCIPGTSTMCPAELPAWPAACALLLICIRTGCCAYTCRPAKGSRASRTVGQPGSPSTNSALDLRTAPASIGPAVSILMAHPVGSDRSR